MAQDFPRWLQKEMNRQGLSVSELARKSGVYPATVSNVLSGNRGIGKAVARKLAKGLNLGEGVVFYRAGITSEDPKSIREELDTITLDILAMLGDMPDYQKRAAREMIASYKDSLNRGLNGQGPG